MYPGTWCWSLWPGGDLSPGCMEYGPRMRDLTGPASICDGISHSFIINRVAFSGLVVHIGRMEVLYTNFQLPNRKWTVDASPHWDPAVDVYLPHRNLAVTWVPGRGKPWQYVDRKWIFQ